MKRITDVTLARLIRLETDSARLNALLELKERREKDKVGAVIPVGKTPKVW